MRASRARRVDAMIEALLKAEDRESFVSAVRALDRVLLSGDYVIPLFHLPRQWVAHWSDLKRPANTPLYGYQIDTWWIEPSDTLPDEGRTAAPDDPKPPCFTSAAILTSRCSRIARAGEPRLRRLPIGVVDEPVVGLELHCRPCSRMKAISPSGLAKLLLRKAITAPFGPASICSMPAWRHSALDLDDVEKVAHLLRQRAEAVDQLGGEGLDGLVRSPRPTAGDRDRAAPAGPAHSPPG